MRNNWTTLALFILVLISSGAARCEQRQLRKEILDSYCSQTIDDTGGLIAAQRLKEIEKLGENGRRSLLEIASARRPEANSRDYRSCAFDYLTRLKDARLVPLARRVLSDPREDSQLRAQAANTLSYLGDRESVPLLIASMRSEDSQLAEASIASLGELDDDRAREALRHALSNRAYREHERAIIENIGNQHDAQGFEEISRLAESEQPQDPPVRQALAISLARIGTWKGNIEPAVRIIDDVKDLSERRKLVHTVLASLWRDYYVENPQHPTGSLILDAAIQRFEALLPCS